MNVTEVFDVAVRVYEADSRSGRNRSMVEVVQDIANAEIILQSLQDDAFRRLVESKRRVVARVCSGNQNAPQGG